MAEPPANRGAILRAAIGIGLYAMAFGASFGAISIGSGLTVAQTMVLSLVMFTGASQFAFVGVLASGGSPFAAVSAGTATRGAQRLLWRADFGDLAPSRTCQSMDGALRHRRDNRDGRRSERRPKPDAMRSGRRVLILFTLWQLGSLTGALIGRAIDPSAVGLDAAAPAVFLALLWPMLRRREARWVALGGAAVAMALVPFAPPGVPVVAAAGVALVAGMLPRRHGTEHSEDGEAK